MKFLNFLFIFALVASLAVALPQSDTDTNRCLRYLDCNLTEFSPICCTDEWGTTKTFDNSCVLKTENCLTNKSFLKTADGPCP